MMHDSVLQPCIRYADFAPMFKAEMFDPDQWASIFKKAGAQCNFHDYSKTYLPSLNVFYRCSLDIKAS